MSTQSRSTAVGDYILFQYVYGNHIVGLSRCEFISVLRHHYYNLLLLCCKIFITICSVHCAADDFGDHYHKGLIHNIILYLYSCARTLQEFLDRQKIRTFERYFGKLQVT